MLDSSTLIGIACLIANKSTVDTSAVEAQLSQADKVQIEKIIEGGACLPANLEKLLAETQEKVDQGNHSMKIEGGSPTHDF